MVGAAAAARMGSRQRRGICASSAAAFSAGSWRWAVVFLHHACSRIALHRNGATKAWRRRISKSAAGRRWAASRCGVAAYESGMVRENGGGAADGLAMKAAYMRAAWRKEK